MLPSRSREVLRNDLLEEVPADSAGAGLALPELRCLLRAVSGGDEGSDLPESRERMFGSGREKMRIWFLFELGARIRLRRFRKMEAARNE